MTVSFNIEYRTSWGEEVRIAGLLPESIPMHTTDGIYWTADVELEVPKEGMTINYSYQIEQNQIIIRKEWDSFPRRLFLSGNSKKKYQIKDCWKNIPEQLYYYSSAFTEALLAHPDRAEIPPCHRKGLVIKAYAPRINKDYCLAICGNQKALGNWDPDKAIPMSDANFPEWQIELDASKLKFPLEYKFILYHKEEKKADCWENNPNRYLADPELKTNETLVISDRYAYFDIPVWKGAGIAIPVFSLKSENSFGVGDFGDLKRMIDWAVSTQQKVIQILPINDTTMTHAWTDSYPYNSISIYAFHPMYADIKQMGTLKDKSAAAKFNKKQKELNGLPAMDYEAVNQTKWEYFRLIFKQEGEKVLASGEFGEFFNANKEWLQPYAVFSYLRDAFQTPNFREWPRHSVYNAQDIEKMCRPESVDYPHIALYYYIQFHLHLQLVAATKYAREHGVVLKGDIPIGISRNSVEAWIEPYYFNMNGQAGAPPDAFSVNGQNWGFPTYNWEVMEQDNYQWWQKRFRKMAEYFTAYRIDHILGFFRIWEIPSHSVHGLLGQFVPALPMSVDEIQSYGLPFQKDFMTKPFINEEMLNKMFGDKAAFVKETFVQHAHDDIYEMRPEYDTQRKVEAYFSDKKDEESIHIREGVYALISNVLFVPDRKHPSMYHPRIAVQNDFIFGRLDWKEKDAFNRLYNHYYYQRHNQFWYQEAMKKLPILTQATSMLVCGEDLGMVPDCVPWVMDQLQILSLEIQRMPKNPKHEFGHVWEYPYRSVCTISTHDMSTLRGWWEEDYEQTCRYYNHVMGHWGEVPVSAPGWVCEEIVRHHLECPSLLCILSFQDWLSIDEEIRYPDVNAERINVPANPRHYWRYRMHLTLEELIKNKKFNEKLVEMIDTTGRF